MDVECLLKIIRERAQSSGMEELSISEEGAERVFERIVELSEKESESTRIFDQLRAENEERVDEYISFAPIVLPEKNNKKKRAVYATLLLISLPVVATVSVCALASFGVIFALQFLLMGISFVLLAMSGTVGLALCMINLVYGITQLFTNIRAGAAEIFLSVALLGSLSLVSIGLYLFSTRLLPFLKSKTVQLFCALYAKAKEVILYAKEVFWGL